MEWFSVYKKLPEIGQEVLIYYTINDSEYYCTGRIESITITEYKKEKIKSIEWLDSENNAIEPTYWTPIFPPVGLTK